MNSHFRQTNRLQLHCSAKATTQATHNTSAKVQPASFPPREPMKTGPPHCHTDLARRAGVPHWRVTTHLPGHPPCREAAGEQGHSPLDAATDHTAVSSLAPPPAARIVILIWKLLNCGETTLSLLTHYISPLSGCLNTDCEDILKLIFKKSYLEIQFFLFPRAKYRDKELHMLRGSLSVLSQTLLTPF